MTYLTTKSGEKKSLLEITHDEYIVPKGEEQLVHYTSEKVMHDSVTGKRLTEPIINKTDVKFFDSVIKAEMEKVGNTIYILYHPNGKYVERPLFVDKERVMAEQAAEIERLKAELAKANEDGEKKKGGRPKKEE